MVDVTKLSCVFDWKMTSDEAHAYYLATVWEQETRKLFPNERLARLPTYGDPRKCTLYRYCWKLIRETRGLLKAEEYHQFIQGNLRIIKHHKGRIEPNCLTGDKAWIRWKVWQRLLEKKLAEQRNEIPEDTNINTKVGNELDCTKRFLFEKMDGEPTFQKFEELAKNKLSVWADVGKISKYYLVLSPWVDKLGILTKLEKECGFSKDIYVVNESIKKFFKKEFSYEFNNT